MQNVELPLFPASESPLIIPQNPQEVKPSKQNSHIVNPEGTIEKVLNSIFPQQTEENKVSRTRRILGETAAALSNEQIECINTEFQFLIDTWLDEYEKDVFNGMTLKEVLNEK